MTTADKIKAIANGTPKEEVPMIAYVETYTENDVVKTRIHGPMPVSEWPAYEKEKGL